MIKITCEFVMNKFLKVFCKTHHQCLLYLYDNKLLICQVEEDRLISKYGINKYNKFMGDLK